MLSWGEEVSKLKQNNAAMDNLDNYKTEQKSCRLPKLDDSYNIKE